MKTWDVVLFIRTNTWDKPFSSLNRSFYNAHGTVPPTQHTWGITYTFPYLLNKSGIKFGVSELNEIWFGAQKKFRKHKKKIFSITANTF